jgi:predicted RNA-binding Zn-ribbon protein involved in translation (DUF1610 family)
MTSKKPKYFEKDVRRLEGKGEFPCPGCGTTISPEDKKEENYRLIRTRTRRDELASVTIDCNCGSQIKIKGFSAKPLQRFQYCTV